LRPAPIPLHTPPLFQPLSTVRAMSKIIDKINKEQLKPKRSGFGVGDTVCVHTIVKEGDKERIQKFTGVVIGRRGTDINASFTVRRISYGEGVERVFPLHSPRIDKIVVESKGSVRRAKLNYLRNRTGKAAMAVKEREATAAGPTPAA
jgi:large subunit ribosomal protein L19